MVSQYTRFLQLTEWFYTNDHIYAALSSLIDNLFAEFEQMTDNLTGEHLTITPSTTVARTDSLYCILLTVSPRSSYKLKYPDSCSFHIMQPYKYMSNLLFFRFFVLISYTASHFLLTFSQPSCFFLTDKFLLSNQSNSLLIRNFNFTAATIGK